MGNRQAGWKIASARGMAALMAVVTVFNVAPAISAPSDIFENPAPVLASSPGQTAPVADGDTTVSSQTGALTYSYPVTVPPGRSGMQPHLSLSYSSQGPIFGGLASGWAWNLSIPEIREDVSSSRMKTHYPPTEATQPDPKLDDRFVSSMAGGRPLILVSEPGDPAAYQYRAQSDSSWSRYERMKPTASKPYSWRVYSTDGSVRYFGDVNQTVGCANVSEGFAPLTLETDAFGSEVLYTYESVLAGECRIKNIKYGQNVAAGVAAFAQVDFTYSPDQVVCGGLVSGSSRDYRSGKLIVTGASRLTSITSTAFTPGGSPASAVHTRTVTLGYDVTKESCTLQHAPVKLLTSITESASGVDSPLVTLPPKTFSYNSPATTLVSPGGAGLVVPWLVTAEDAQRKSSLAWGYRSNDERLPTVEAMNIDLDGDGLLDRLYNTSIEVVGGTKHVFNCSARWAKNMGPDVAGGVLNTFVLQTSTITLPRLKWHGPGGAFNTVPGASEAGFLDGNHEGCSLSGMASNYRNSQGPGSQQNNTCHDTTSCNAATNPLDPNLYCNVNAPNKGTACPPRGGPDDLKLTYLAYRWMDVTGDGLVDLVTAVHGSSNYYDIERGNLLTPDNFAKGEPTMFGIPGLDGWPPCPSGAADIDRCANTGPITNEFVNNCDLTGQCVPNWPVISTAVSSAPKVGCGGMMAKPGPGGGGGGGGGAPSRAPYERCQGLYPWIIYPGLGNGTFATAPTIKYQPVPLESDSGDSSFGGPGIASTNHAIQDFDGDGSLDAVVHFDEHVVGGTPNAWQVWFGDRTGQMGPRMYLFATRPNPLNTIAGLGQQGATLSESSTGLLDFNGDGIPDHWRLDASHNVNIALNNGLYLDLTTLNNGFINTPLVGGVGVKPGADATYTGATPPIPGSIRLGTSTSNNRPVDVDGDGRVDVVRWNGGSPQVFWNYGGQLSSTGVSYPGDTAGDRRRVEATENVPDLYWELESDLVDFDGDGINESVSFPNPGASQFYRANPQYTQPPRMLSIINNGRGATTTVAYASMHDMAVVQQDPALVVNGRPKASPTTQWVVKSMTTSDAFATGTATTGYVYKYPVHGKDDEGRYGFRGFEQVTTTSPSGSRTIQRYSYVPDWSGRLATTVLMPKLLSGEGDNDARTIDITTWEERQLFGGAVKTYHATRSQHFTCKNTQGDPTDPYAVAPTTPCNATTAGGYSSTITYLNALVSSTSGNSTPLLWQETDTLLQSGTAAANGDRKTKLTFTLNADTAVYRLRPISTLNTVQVAGSYVTYGRTATTWDATYRVPLTDETWFDNVDANRAISRTAYDMATGNALQHWKPIQNAASSSSTTFTYDARKLFVATEVNELGHQRDMQYEYGTGAKLQTEGPNQRTCVTGQPNCPADATHPPKEQHKVRVDGLGRTIERWETVSEDGVVYVSYKVGTNSYVDAASGTTPTSRTNAALVDELGTTWKQEKTELDGHGRPTKITIYSQGTAPNDQITTFVYRPEGTLQSVSVPDPTTNNASVVSYTYGFDSLGRATSIRRPDSTTTPSGVDIVYNGAITTTTENLGGFGGQQAQTRTTNDRFGRLAQVEERTVTSPATFTTTTYTYSADDNVATITSPPTTSGGASVVTTLTHDLAGRRTKVARHGREWKYTYDANGNQTSEQVPGSGGPMTDLNFTTSVAYDALDRETSRSVGRRSLSDTDLALFNSATEVSTWDLSFKGQLRYWQAYPPTGPNQITMDLYSDGQGRRTITSEAISIAGYPLLSQQYFQTYYWSGATRYSRYRDLVGGANETLTKTHLDARGLPSKIEMITPQAYDLAVQTRNVAGLVLNRRSATTGTGYVESNWAYDKLGRVQSQTVRKGPTLSQVAKQVLTYFGNDDPKTLQHVLGTAAKTFTYGYDQRHQLTTVATDVSSYFGATFAYGPGGRFTRVQETRTVTPPTGADLAPRNVNYVYGDSDPERVTALTNVSGCARYATFAYDAAGNMTWKCMGATFSPTCAGESFDYVYDGKDQMRRATRKVNNVVTGSEEYWYDNAGQRFAVVKRNASGGKTELVWFVGDVEAHYDGTGATTKIYSHLSMGTPVARVERTGNTTTNIEYQFHGLASNTLAAIDKATGTVNASFSYAPFGEVLEATDAGGSAGIAGHKRRFNDKFQDDLSGLTYYGARYYDKSVLSWTQSDPLYRFAPDSAWTAPRDANLFTFDKNNALRYLDPDGRKPWGAIIEDAVAHDENREPHYESTVADRFGDAVASVIGIAIPPVGAAMSVAKTIEKITSGNEGYVSPLAGGTEPIDGPSPPTASTPGAPPGGRPPGSNNKNETRLGTAGGERAGQNFTPRGKQEVKESNIAENGPGAGGGVCERCGGDMVPSTQSRSGVSPAPNEVRVDHINPKVPAPGSGMPPGDGSPPNGQAICYDCNGDKGNKPE